MAHERRRSMLDLERLEAQAEALSLHRFLERVRSVRVAHGRFLVVGAADQEDAVRDLEHLDLAVGGL